MNRQQGGTEGENHEGPLVAPPIIRRPEEASLLAEEEQVAQAPSPPPCPKQQSLSLVLDDTLTDPGIQIGMGRNDVRRQYLTRQEHEWALELKDMMDGLPDLDPVSDFMITQLAIVTQGNVEDAINRAYGLQEFRHEYDILDSYEDGCRRFDFMVSIFPQHILSFSFSERDGTYVIVHDASQFDSKTHLTTPSHENNWLASCYYVHSALTPDIQTIRQGHMSIMECSRVDWKQKHDFQLMKKMFFEFVRHYPFSSYAMHCYNTGMIVNILTSMITKVLPKKLRDSFQFGKQSERPLYELYLTPTIAAANQKLLSNIKETLRRRYDNERTFVLDNFVPAAEQSSSSSPISR